MSTLMRIRFEAKMVIVLIMLMMMILKKVDAMDNPNNHDQSNEGESIPEEDINEVKREENIAKMSSQNNIFSTFSKIKDENEKKESQDTKVEIISSEEEKENFLAYLEAEKINLKKEKINLEEEGIEMELVDPKNIKLYEAEEQQIIILVFDHRKVYSFVLTFWTNIVVIALTFIFMVHWTAMLSFIPLFAGDFILWKYYFKRK